jgi:phosphatidate phosphatase APP1
MRFPLVHSDLNARRRPAFASCLALAGALLMSGCAQGADPVSVIVYPGYGYGGRFFVEGRVIEAHQLAQDRKSDAWWRNLWRNLRRMVNDEQADVTVALTLGDRHWSVVTDDEGYFRLAGTVSVGTAAGWRRLSARTGGASAAGAVLLVPENNTLGIISDVDDTILVSDVTDKSELLKNTFLKNPTQRKAVPGVADFYRRLAFKDPQPEAAPIFYLSASPRQLAFNIQEFLDQAGFPRGVLIAKKVTDDATGEPLFDQRTYKIAHIEKLLQRLPHVKFVLVGDDGEQDPEIYHDIQSRYPERVAAVYIRHVSPDPARRRFEAQRDLMVATGRP